MKYRQNSIKFISATFFIIVLGLFLANGFLSSNRVKFFARADNPTYTVSLGQVSAAEATAKSFTRKTSGGADITFNTKGSVTNLSGYVANMSYANDNAIYNVTPITGLKQITFNVANHANIKLMYGSDPDNLEYTTETYADGILNTNIVVDLSDAVNASYFKFVHFSGTGCYLKSFTIGYSCAVSAIRGEAFGSTGFTKSLAYTLDEVATIDVKFTSNSSTHIALALLDDWNNYFGYYNINANGTVSNTDGISMKLLNDGYYRVTLDLDQLSVVGAGTPTKVTTLFARSSWTDASGYIDFEPTSKVLRTVTKDYAFTAGTAITPAQSMKLPADKELILDIQFSLEDDTGKQIALVFATDWSNMYGYFNLTNNGTVSWTGVGKETIGERHYRYYFDIDLLPKYAGSSPTIVDFVWANGGSTTANGTLTIIEVR